MTKRLALSVVMAAVIAGVFVEAQYSAALQKKFVATVAGGAKGWRGVSYPTDNFGIGTMYDDKGDAGFLCATASCLGLSSAWAPELTAFVAEGGGGALTLTDTEKREFAIDALIPRVLSLASLGANFNKKSVTITELTFDGAVVRRLEREPVLKRLEGLSSQSPIRRAFDAGKLRVVVADVVVRKLSVKIKIDKNLDAGLVAKMDKVAALSTDVAPATPPGGASAVPDAAKEKGPGLTLSVKRGNVGEFTLSSSQPLIVAILLKKQPAEGQLSGQTWDNWVDDTALAVKWAPAIK
jgi:hypothetical protein